MKEYNEMYGFLKDRINFQDERILIDDETVIHNFTFTSGNVFFLPGESEYVCPEHEFMSSDQSTYYHSCGIQGSILDIHDSQIAENKQFRYHIMTSGTATKVSEFILLIHGFNEKTWKKYLPWARYLVETTGKAVVLFPIAFHMNRAPKVWSDNRAMFDLSDIRRKHYSDIVGTSLSNVAISARLHEKPQRFFFSGLQTYYDVIQLLTLIKDGKHPLVSHDARYDLFAYSIGGLLAEILMMTSHRGYFDQSKMILFCGGNVFNRFSPVSRFILDSEANVALYSYIIEHLANHLRKDERLRHYLSPLHPEGANFKAMLNYNVLRPQREEALRRISQRTYAIALEKDVVAPSYEVINTLKGINRDIPIEVDVFDFDYPYIHENPFPGHPDYTEKVDRAFKTVFERVAGFYSA